MACKQAEVGEKGKQVEDEGQMMAAMMTMSMARLSVRCQGRMGWKSVPDLSDNLVGTLVSDAVDVNVKLLQAEVMLKMVLGCNGRSQAEAR